MEILIIILLILFNGFLSMSEIALVSARKTRLEIESKRGNSNAKAAFKLAKEPNRFLSTIQIGITLVGILTGLYSGETLASSLAVYISMIPLLAGSSAIISKIIIVTIVTYLTLIVGELVPKRLGMNYAERVSMIAARPMLILSKIASPFIWLLSYSTSGVIKILGVHSNEENKVTEEEIKAIIKEGFDGGEVQEVEQDIVERVFNLGDRDVCSIMTHRSDLIWFDLNDTPSEIRKKVQKDPYNLYPVSDGKFDEIKGVVYLKDLFCHIDDPNFTLKNIITEPKYVPENQSVYSVLEQFKNAEVPYSIVIDEFGGIQGIVTLKDIMEGLVGQVSGGDEPEITKRADGSLLVDGQYKFYDFLEYFDLEDLYNEHDYNTLSGLILEILERVPKTGERLNWLDFEFEIVDMDGARIDKVLVKYNKKE